MSSYVRFSKNITTKSGESIFKICKNIADNPPTAWLSSCMQSSETHEAQAIVETNPIQDLLLEGSFKKL